MAIKSKDIGTIFHARKSLLYREGEPWINVTMGSYDGAEVCELYRYFHVKFNWQQI